MKLGNIFMLGCLCAACLSACSDDETTTGGKMSKETGILSLGVKTNAKANVVTPDVSSRVSSGDTTIDAFTVAIYDSSADTIVKQYASYSVMEDEVVLPVGDYKVVAQSPGEMQTKMSEPYFKGEATFAIKKGITDNVDVTCKMQNLPIKMQYGPTFVNAFKSWEIMLDDGQNHTLSFKSTAENPDVNPAVVYWAVEGAEAINVNVTAVTTDGKTVVEAYRCTKSAASDQYVGDTTYFGPGDGITINFTPKEEDVASGCTIDIKVNLDWVITDEDEVNVDVTVDPVGGGNDDDDDPVVTPPVSQDAPTIQLPADFSYSTSDESSKPATANATLKAPAGMASAKVKIITSNKDSENSFQSTLADTDFPGKGDLLVGAELIGNIALKELFEGVELDNDVPHVNDKEYVFPIHAFFLFLDMFSGVHQFEITLTDVNGDTVTKTLTITITD